MNISRWFLSTCLGTMAVYCVLYPLSDLPFEPEHEFEVSKFI
jgi:hypothetical protein